ncbi:MAG: hypothetical protein JSR49_01720 [Proteobacteria bacterium]|nr:hypothetical protein [Pseudomonadota bacterium]
MPNAAVSASSIGHSERGAADAGNDGEDDEEEGGAGELMRGWQVPVAERTPVVTLAVSRARRRALAHRAESRNINQMCRKRRQHLHI